LDTYRKDPNTLFAIIDCQRIGMGTPPSHLWLGVTGVDADGGARITSVTPDSPAAKAEPKVGDTVKTADGKAVTNYAGLTAVLRGHKDADKISLVVLREGAMVAMALTLEERPLGAYGQGPPTLPLLLGALGEDAEGGIKVTRVFDEGAAGRAGLREGDLLEETDGKPVTRSAAGVEMLGVGKAREE